MIGTLACWSPQPIFAQTDVTETYLKNPSFENQFTDWENSGMQSQTNTSFQRVTRTWNDGQDKAAKWPTAMSAKL